MGKAENSCMVCCGFANGKSVHGKAIGRERPEGFWLRSCASSSLNRIEPDAGFEMSCELGCENDVVLCFQSR
jgi:hypothetical protein